MSKAMSCYPPCWWISIFCGETFLLLEIERWAWVNFSGNKWSQESFTYLGGDLSDLSTSRRFWETRFLQAIVAYLFVTRRRCGEKTLVGLGKHCKYAGCSVIFVEDFPQHHGWKWILLMLWSGKNLHHFQKTSSQQQLSRQKHFPNWKLSDSRLNLKKHDLRRKTLAGAAPHCALEAVWGGVRVWYWGSDERRPGMMYFPTKWGAKEP